MLRPRGQEAPVPTHQSALGTQPCTTSASEATDSCQKGAPSGVTQRPAAAGPQGLPSFPRASPASLHLQESRIHPTPDL